MRDERLVIVHRQVAAPEVLRGALSALLAGPSAAERGIGTASAVPTGTRLIDVALSEGLATVDLSGEFDDGGGSFSMTARVAEVVFTATQFDKVERVAFRLDRVPVQYLGGEGLDISEPQTRLSVGYSFTGGVLLDTPSPGATVRSPFHVTGESDVYEGQFPVEVWSGDELIGGVAPVTGGAWGDWRPFDALITLDAPPGPIRIVAYDEGGCGTGPECPPIVKAVVDVTLAA